MTKLNQKKHELSNIELILLMNQSKLKIYTFKHGINFIDGPKIVRVSKLNRWIKLNQSTLKTWTFK